MTGQDAAHSPRFVTGSTMRHVVTMTFTGAIGLMALFVVDLADLFFLGLLGKTEVTAAIGYGGALAFANLSMSVGTGIAAAALVSRSLGAGTPERAREFATSTLMFSMIVAAALSAGVALAADPLIRLLGAQGEALALAKLYVRTMTPGFVLLSGALACSFILRGIGDARRAMYITLSAAGVTAVLDPVFIFAFGWGIQGAAAANVMAYLVAFGIGLDGVARRHRFLMPLRLGALRRDLRDILDIAIPAVLTQLATPFTNAYLTRAVAPYGDEAVAASAIIGRLVPVAFGIVFALSGSVGPIIGQNFGAGRFDRVRSALRDGLIFSAIYTVTASFILLLFRHRIAGAFGATGRTSELVVFFCTFIAISWAFAGAQFVSNAACNNLGHPNLSTAFNWGKATLGTIPFAWWGAAVAGPEGILAGTAIGAVIFGLASASTAYRIVQRLEARQQSRIDADVSHRHT